MFHLFMGTSLFRRFQNNTLNEIPSHKTFTFCRYKMFIFFNGEENLFNEKVP